MALHKVCLCVSSQLASLLALFVIAPPLPVCYPVERGCAQEVSAWVAGPVKEVEVAMSAMERVWWLTTGFAVYAGVLSAESCQLLPSCVQAQLLCPLGRHLHRLIAKSSIAMEQVLCVSLVAVVK